MGTTSKLLVLESDQELIKLRKQQTDLKSEKRIECLRLLKSKRFSTQQETADYLGISRQTIVRWITGYNQGGIEGLLPKKTKNKKSKIITPEIHQGLANRVNSSDAPFLGYWDATEWVNAEYGVTIKYHWLRKYLIRHFKTKLKSPRKSHYKKDDQAIDAFLKTP